jgi:hypothetical protein
MIKPSTFTAGKLKELNIAVHTKTTMNHIHELLYFVHEA